MPTLRVHASYNIWQDDVLRQRLQTLEKLEETRGYAYWTTWAMKQQQAYVFNKHVHERNLHKGNLVLYYPGSITNTLKSKD